MKRVKSDVLVATLSASRSRDASALGVAVWIHHPHDEPELIFEIYEHGDPELGELLAIKRVLEYAIERGCRKVKIRSNQQQMRKRLKARLQPNRHRKLLSPPSALEAGVISMAESLDRFQVGFVQRRNNLLARRLARTAWESARFDGA